MMEREDVAQPQDVLEEPRAVERRDRDQVEERDGAVPDHSREQGGATRRPGTALRHHASSGREADGEEEIGRWPRERHPQRVTARMAETRMLDRRGSAPGENERRSAGDQRERQR